MRPDIWYTMISETVGQHPIPKLPRENNPQPFPLSIEHKQERFTTIIMGKKNLLEKVNITKRRIINYKNTVIQKKENK